ncbi:hypothetical protein QVG61_12020 [Thiohalobacter sp. IOR34]|uniref:hypothetical protein n=1 Tax=Thiohalobacter sp. IOR34 TaxID=3057176 RepID=UPI0025B1F7B4|nr:hypothetical protein [Thiohalobacter sp. IOR34]WJW75204.1 hypothetical protein QVG61_12020 [Thiohalobacter sp. IOR34]
MKYAAGYLAAFFLLLQGCTSVNTFPTIARAGDTVSVMVGGTEKARKDTIAVTLTDVNGQTWDLQALGLVRSVFNLRPDGRAVGLHYSDYLDTYISWSEGHEPVQTVLVANLPPDVPAGIAYLTVDAGVDDDSSGVTAPFTVNLEIIAGAGSSDDFLRQDAFSGNVPADFARLEPAPHAKISFGITDGVVIGAASLVVDFDETVVNPADINIYVPESTVRGSVVDPGAFGKTQRMVYWRQDGQQLYIDVIAPQGINQAYLAVYIVHPPGLSGDPAFSMASARIYDVDGNEIVHVPTLEYFP